MRTQSRRDRTYPAFELWRPVLPVVRCSAPARATEGEAPPSESESGMAPRTGGVVGSPAPARRRHFQGALAVPQRPFLALVHTSHRTWLPPGVHCEQGQQT